MTVVTNNKIDEFVIQSEAWLISTLPTPLRFLGIGAIGLTMDMACFVIFSNHGFNPFIARALSLALATLITWRLNKALTFSKSGRRSHEEAMRYVVVTTIAQSISYLTFALLISTMLQGMPLIAIFLGAIVGTVVSYNGHRLFSFAQK